MPEPVRRSVAIDMAKGVAIVLVVYGHCLRGLVAAGVVSGGEGFSVPDYVIYTFHMPLFFVASGYFFVNAERKGAASFWTSRVQTIAYPYVLWSLVQGAVQIALSGSAATNGRMEWSSLLVIGWKPISPFWFLYALFFAFAFTWLLRKRPAVWLPMMALPAFLLSFFLVQGTLEDVAYGFLYFSLGVLARERGWLVQVSPAWPAALLYAFGFIVAALGCYQAGVPERLPFPAAILGIVATLAMCLAAERRHFGSWGVAALAALGRYSMGIYVMHILVLGLVRTAMVRFLHVAAPGLIVPVAMIAGIAIPVAVQFVLVRMNLNRWAGLPFSAAMRDQPVPAMAR